MYMLKLNKSKLLLQYNTENNLPRRLKGRTLTATLILSVDIVTDLETELAGVVVHVEPNVDHAGKKEVAE